MSAAHELPDLDDALIEDLAPLDAPSDDEIVTADDDPEGETAPAAERVGNWVPDGPEAADWVARKAKRATAGLDRLQAQRDRLVAQADAWLAKERVRHDRTIAWAESMLHIWLDEAIRADESKKPRKSRELPCGVKVKKTPGGKSLVIEDEKKLLEWLDDNYPDCLNITPKKGEVKKLLTGDGVAVPGVSIDQSPEGFKVELGGAS